MTNLGCIFTPGLLDHYIICSIHTISIKQRWSNVHFKKESKKKAIGWGRQSRHPVAYWRWNISSRKSWLISHWALVSIATTPRSSVRMVWSWSKKNMQPHHHRHWPHFQPHRQVRGDPCPPCIPETHAHFHPEQEGHKQGNMLHPLSSVCFFRFQPLF